MPCWQKDSLILTGPGIYPQIYQRTSCPVVLICKGVWQNTKKGWDYFKYSKRRDFFISFDNQVLLRAISQCGSVSYPVQKRPSSPPSLWLSRAYTWTLNWKEILLICSENCLGVPYSYRQSRNMMMNAFIIANIIPICKR